MLKTIRDEKGEVLGFIEDSNSINQHLVLTLKGLGFTVEDAQLCEHCHGTGIKEG